MSFPAKFESKGLCPAGCGYRIHTGDAIRKDDNGQFVHDECAPKADRFTIGAHEVVCPDCWLVKPCRCDDE